MYRTTLSDEQNRAYWHTWKFFPGDILARALDAYARGEGGGRFPTAPAIGLLADRIWHEASAKARHEDRARERRAAAMLLEGPVAAWGERGTLARMAVELVRDLCNGSILPGSEDHQRRQAEVERKAGRWPERCSCADGLLWYTRSQGDRVASYVARCACPLGEQRPAAYPRMAPDEAQSRQTSEAQRREQRDRAIARYHAQGDARMEPCGPYCDHESAIGPSG